MASLFIDVSPKLCTLTVIPRAILATCIVNIICTASLSEHNALHQNSHNSKRKEDKTLKTESVILAHIDDIG